MDQCSHGKLFSGNWFFDESIAWKNKWKNRDPNQGERFLGSSTFLVFLTSGWHLSQEILIDTVFILIFGWNWYTLLYNIIFKIIFDVFSYFPFKIYYI